MKRAFGICIGALAINAGANAGGADDKSLDRFERTGETVNCLNMRTTDITAIDENTFLFRSGPNEYYLNETKSACKGAGSGFTRIELTLYGNRLCSGDIVKVADQQSGIYRGACGLGDFEKLAKKPPPPSAE